MRFWKVRVSCWREGGKRPITRWFLVEAENSAAAKQQAWLHAEKTALFGPLWFGFEALEASTINLPMEFKP